MWADIPLGDDPAQSLVKTCKLRTRAQPRPPDTEREAILRGAVHQRRRHAAAARVLLDPYRCHPWRQLRPLLEIGFDHRSGAEKSFAIMRDQREGDRRVLHVFAQARSDVGQRIAARLPPCPPDPVGDGVEKRRASAQVRNGEWQLHRLILGATWAGADPTAIAGGGEVPIRLRLARDPEHYCRPWLTFH